MTPPPSPADQAREALAACPFCGGEAAFEWHSGPAWIECQKCGAIGPNDLHTTAEQNEAAWNSCAAIAERDRLREALESARGWVVTCSSSAQARKDLKQIDAALSARAALTPGATS